MTALTCLLATGAEGGGIALRADSKQLTEAKRDSLYDEIMANNNIGWSRGELTAEYISAGMLRK